MLKAKICFTGKSVFVLMFLLFTTTNVLGSDCFSPSPSIEAGRGPYDEIIPGELEDGEYEALEELLEGLGGRLEGTAEVLSVWEPMKIRLKR